MDASHPPLTTVLAHGGWLVVDPRPIAAAHPDTFELPTPDELAAIRPGTAVRAIVALADQADHVRDSLAPYDEAGRPQLVVANERMWFVVLERDELAVETLLDSQPLATHTRLGKATRVRLPLTHLIALDEGPDDLPGYLSWIADLGFRPVPESAAAVPEDPHRPPTLRPSEQAISQRFGVAAERPWLFARCLVADDVSDSAAPPLYGARFAPQSDRGDCGWTIWASDADLESVSTTVGFSTITVQELAERRGDVLPYLVLPPGWGFTLAPGHEEAYPIDLED